jgi:hypothetical protein
MPEAAMRSEERIIDIIMTNVYSLLRAKLHTAQEPASRCSNGIWKFTPLHNTTHDENSFCELVRYEKLPPEG